jgi:hypothetical protein
MLQRPAKFRLTVVRLYLTKQPCQEKVKVLEELQDKKPQKTQYKQEQPKGLRNKQRTENNKLCRNK